MNSHRHAINAEEMDELQRKVFIYRGMPFLGLVAREAKNTARRGSGAWQSLRHLLKNRRLFERAALGIGQLFGDKYQEGLVMPDDITNDKWGQEHDERNENDRVFEESDMGTVAEAEEWCKLHDNQGVSADMEPSETIQANVSGPRIPDKESNTGSSQGEGGTTCREESELNSK